MTGRQAFTLIELLVVVAIIGILAAMLLPAMARAKESTRSTSCLSQVKQLALTSTLYAQDHNQHFPPPLKRWSWDKALASYYQNKYVLRCPSEKNRKDSWEPDYQRDYLMNGFADYILFSQGDEGYNAFRKGSLIEGFPEEAARHPSKTILFGEKQPTSMAFYLDLLKQNSGFIDDMDESRHANLRREKSRGSANFGFMDGSASSLPFGKSTCPENMWGTLEQSRHNEALCRPRF